jgi:hypothetical protein
MYLSLLDPRTPDNPRYGTASYVRTSIIILVVSCSSEVSETSFIAIPPDRPICHDFHQHKQQQQREHDNQLFALNHCIICIPLSSSTKETTVQYILKIARAVINNQ